ncbi:MAG: ABC transporter ATP-binding protein [Dehalococcoidia bacterium]|nr:MAG: ABC transporter ATP-binding protein [Dehalococcoidia bacterium]
MLEINNIEVKYKGLILVLKGLSLHVDKGGLVCVLGSNGAGKTTLLKSTSGLLKIEEGRVTDGNIVFDGKRIDNMSPPAIVRMGIVQVMEGRRIFGHLSTEENVIIGANLFSDSRVRQDLEMVYNYFPQLKGLRSKTCGYLSGGEQQMVVIGRALMARPRIILLDEPSLGLSPILQTTIFELVRRISAEQKVGVLLVEQNALAALSISDYGYVLENGRVVLDGPSDSLKDNEDIKEFYLGLSKVGERKSYRGVKHYRRRKRWLG